MIRRGLPPHFSKMSDNGMNRGDVRSHSQEADPGGMDRAKATYYIF